MGMNTKPSLGTGFAGVWAHAVAAGIIASSNGRARAACAVFSMVRRGIAFFVRNIRLSSYLCRLPATGYRRVGRLRAAHQERNALDDAEDERRKTVAVPLRVVQDLPHRGRVVVLHAS